MNFKVGQRVRIARWDATVLPKYRGLEVTFDGMTGTPSPIFLPLADCWVRYRGKRYYAYTGYLEPLLPPAADEWAADQVRKVTKPVYTEPERVREKTT